MDYIILTICFLLSTLNSSLAFPNGVGRNADEVGKLPLIDFPLNFKHYSGYLESTEGIQLHYWFFESQNNPKDDPVVVWLNGGPGCSSLYGAFTENGPIQANKNGTFSLNPYSWNLKANLLYIETPVHVGFSYNTSAVPNNTDARTVDQNVDALISFFVKFPHLINNPFYITGESYAGHYIPQLAIELIKLPFPANFRGVAIGNGYFDQDESNTSVLYDYSHGIRDDNTIEKKPFQRKHESLNKKKGDGFLNGYNILADCDDDFESTNDTNAPPVCSGVKTLISWLNRADVQKAIHITGSTQAAPVPWNDCSGEDYTFSKEPMNTYVRIMADVGLRVVIYNGDLDTVCNFIRDERFVANLGYPVFEEYNSWLVDGEVVKVIGGYKKSYRKGNLIFTTVRGAGHMVPFDKPQSALKILNEFLLQLPED